MLGEASLQRFHPRAELGQFVLQGVYIGLDRRWGVLPVLWRAGLWPVGVYGLRQRFHDISKRPPTRSGGWTVDSGERRSSPAENARRVRDAKRSDLRLPRVATL